MKGREINTFQAATMARAPSRGGKEGAEGGNGEARLAIRLPLQWFPFVF